MGACHSPQSQVKDLMQTPLKPFPQDNPGQVPSDNGGPPSKNLLHNSAGYAFQDTPLDERM